MKKINPILKLALLACIMAINVNDVFAVKVIKHRDHHWIFGGYDKVKEVAEVTSEGMVVELFCTGNGDMKCKSDIASQSILTHENGHDLTTPEYELIEDLHEFADTQGGNGESQGTKTEVITISYPDGTLVSYTYQLIWYVDSDGKFVSEVTFI